jgi:energy-coupling factor transporter ATP-binding protein EcfA2
MSVKKFSEREEGFNTFTNHLGQTVRVDPTLAHNLLSIVEAAQSTGGDVWVAVTGPEGSGKSTLGRQLGKLCDNTFDEKRIEFQPDDFVKAQFKGLPENWDTEAYMNGEYPNKPWEVIQLDESAKLDRKKTMTSGSVEFTGFSTQNRQLHKINFIILPNAHMLDSYIMEFRVVALIDCYKYRGTQMGFYRWYTKKLIKKMFNSEMHKRKEYPSNPAFSGRFTGKEAFDITEYNKKKAAALNAYRKGMTGKEGESVNEAEVISKYELVIIKRAIEKGIKHEAAIYQALGMPGTTWRRKKKDLIEKMGVKAKPILGPALRALALKELQPEPEHPEANPEPNLNLDSDSQISTRATTRINAKQEDIDYTEPEAF